MKTATVAVIIAGIIVVAGITSSFIRKRDVAVGMKPPARTREDTSPRIVHVDDLAKNPEDFKGEIVLRAVVVGVKKSEGVFGIVDSREFESCGTLTCATNILPVKFSGEPPATKTVVRITGRVVRNDKGLIVEAKSVGAAP